MAVKRCIECGEPARLLRDVSGFSEHCSDACVALTWQREIEQGRIVCVGEITVKQIDAALSTTGWTVPGGEA